MKIKKKTMKRLKAVMKGKLPIEKLKFKELQLLDQIMYEAVELLYLDRMMPPSDKIH
jgi:hypothetical protein